MIPLAIGGTALLGGAILQAFNNARTSKAEKKELDRLQKLADDVQKPDFSYDDISPDMIDLVFNYNPESIPMIREAAPQLVEKSQVAQQSQQSQMGALDRFEQLAQTGEDAQLIAAREGAEREAMETLSRAQAEREAMSQRRGLGLGSGAQLALQQADIASTAERQQAMNEQAAADAALRRFQANQQVGSLGGQIFGQDINLSSQNAAIANEFNRRQAEREQQIAMQNVQDRNQAALMTEQARQAAENQNTATANQIRQFNAQMQQQAAQNQFNADTGMYGMQAGMTDRRLGQTGQASERVARTISGVSSGIAGLAGGMQQDQKDKASGLGSLMGAG